MISAALLRALPPSLRITLADVGSAGGIHKRWRPIRDHVATVLFDPLDPQPDTALDRYFPVALASAPGTATLHVTKRVSMTSLLLPNAGLLERFWDKPDHTQVVQTIEVPTERLDTVMSANAIDLDVIKIDVQGFEHDILSGATECLKRSIFLAEIEVSFFERYAGLHRFEDVIDLMRGCGFDLIDIGRIKRYRYRNTHNVVNPGLGMGDRAGRIAFCDALFMLNDDTLRARIEAAGPDLALKAILALLTYGKADIAAWIFDAAGDRIDPKIRAPLSAYLKAQGGRHFGRRGLHRALDYLARKV